MKPPVKVPEDNCPGHQQDEARARSGVMRRVCEDSRRVLNKFEHSGRDQDGETSIKPSCLGVTKNRCDWTRRQCCQHGAGYIKRPDAARRAIYQVARIEPRAGAKLQHIATGHVAKETTDGFQFPSSHPSPGKTR